jgi:NhaP-type Na+/H+ or K+/H+ antiporter
VDFSPKYRFCSRLFLYLYWNLDADFRRRIAPFWIGIDPDYLFYAHSGISLTIPKGTPLEDATLFSVVIPKGLAAAVLASVPLQHGVSGGEYIQNLTYAVVMFSIVLTSILIFLVDKTNIGGIYHFLLGKFRKPVVLNSRKK